MSNDSTWKGLCLASPGLAALAHVSMFYISWPVPYPVVGGLAIVAGACGLLLRRAAGKKRPDERLGVVYPLIAGAGIIGGAFYASMVGPFIVFFPQI